MWFASPRAKTNEAPDALASASYEPSKENVFADRFLRHVELEASHLRKPSRKAVKPVRQVVHATIAA